MIVLKQTKILVRYNCINLFVTYKRGIVVVSYSDSVSFLLKSDLRNPHCQSVSKSIFKMERMLVMKSWMHFIGILNNSNHFGIILTLYNISNVLWMVSILIPVIAFMLYDATTVSQLSNALHISTAELMMSTIYIILCNQRSNIKAVFTDLERIIAESKCAMHFVFQFFFF